MFGWLKRKKEDKIEEPVVDPLAPYQDAIAALALPTIRIRAVTTMAPGRSYFGGGPMLADPDAWPKNPNSGELFQFLAQIDFAHVRDETFGAVTTLPASGVLQVFVDENYESGANGETFEFLFIPEAGPERVAGPSHPSRPFAMSFGIEKTWPTELGLVGLNVPREVEHAYETPEETPEHQLLGYPSPVQCDPMYDFQSDDANMSYRDWTMLLEINSDNLMDTNFMDGGAFYFYIRKDALATMDLSDVRMVVQSC